MIAARSGIRVECGTVVAEFRCLACVADPSALCECLIHALDHARKLGDQAQHVRTYRFDGALLATTKLEESRVAPVGPVPQPKPQAKRASRRRAA